jgi:cytoskeleton protein RodZ
VTTTPTSPDRATSAGIGSVLRRARTERGLSLADLQARTKIRAKYLAALEAEEFHELPPLPFARGFVASLANELGLDAVPLVRRLSAAMAADTPSARGWRRLDGAITPAVPPSRLRRLGWILGLAVIVIGGVLAVIFAQQLRQLSEPPVPEAPESQVTREAPGPSSEPQPAPESSPAGGVPAVTSAETAAPAEPAPLLPAPEGRVVADLETTGRSWLLIVADGQTVFQGFMESGRVQRWEARIALRLRIGNAGAVALAVNGSRLGTLGRLGEVVDRTFTPDDYR